jgi:hypothetical protein
MRNSPLVGVALLRWLGDPPLATWLLAVKSEHNFRDWSRVCAETDKRVDPVVEARFFILLTAGELPQLGEYPFLFRSHAAAR